MKVHLTRSERDTVLAALRLYQAWSADEIDVNPRRDRFQLVWIEDIARDSGDPLNASDIDELCEKLNP